MLSISLLGAHHARRRTLLQLSAAALLCHSSGAAWAQSTPVTSLQMHRAARFRALSQRIAKAYCQAFLNVQPEDAAMAMASSRQLLRAGLQELGKQPWPDALARPLAQVRQFSEGLDTALPMPPTRQSVADAAAQADKMLQSADAVADGLQKIAPFSTDKLVSTAGQQRMLSQRLAKNYFLAAAGLESKDLREQRAADAAEFKRGLASLAASTVSNTTIRSEMTAGEMQWMFLEAALAREPDLRGLRAVASTSERLLGIMDNLALQYEVALKDLRS